MNQPLTNLLTMILGVSILTGCSSSSESSSSTTSPDTLDITVSILPQQYFVEKIGGKEVNVNVMVQPGDNLHIYEPKPQQLTALSESEAYVTIGVPFEKAWMAKIKSANPQIQVIDSAKGIERMDMIEHEDHHADHDSHEKHAEETEDPHIWLSPQLVKVQAENIYQGLVQLDPANEATYQANLSEFLAEIDQLDQQIKQNLTGITNRQFIVFHPAWGYFARDYNLTQIPVEVGGQEPSAVELGELIKEAKKENIKVIFAQYQLNTKTVQTIAQEINGEMVIIDPLSPEWSENLLNVSQVFANTLKRESN